MRVDVNPKRALKIWYDSLDECWSLKQYAGIQGTVALRQRRDMRVITCRIWYYLNADVSSEVFGLQLSQHWSSSHWENRSIDTVESRWYPRHCSSQWDGSSWSMKTSKLQVMNSKTSWLYKQLPKTTKRKDMKLIVLSPCNAAEEQVCGHSGYVSKRYSGRGLWQTLPLKERKYSSSPHWSQWLDHSAKMRDRLPKKHES